MLYDRLDRGRHNQCNVGIEQNIQKRFVSESFNGIRLTRKFYRLVSSYRVVHPKSDIGVYIKAKSIVRLHGHVMCHINGNFVGFQNMYDLKMSDY